jgi:hypothetical protein
LLGERSLDAWKDAELCKVCKAALIPTAEFIYPWSPN